MKTLYLVYDLCDCEDPGCFSKAQIAVYESEQTARQEAEIRSKRYGGMSNSPRMHMQKINVSTKVSRY